MSCRRRTVATVGITWSVLTLTIGSRSSGGNVAERTLREQMVRTIRAGHPHVYCDTCLALGLRVSLEQARKAAAEVANSRGFQRKEAVCGQCARTQEVTALL